MSAIFCNILGLKSPRIATYPVTRIWNICHLCSKYPFIELLNFAVKTKFSTHLRNTIVESRTCNTKIMFQEFKITTRTAELSAFCQFELLIPHLHFSPCFFAASESLCLHLTVLGQSGSDFYFRKLHEKVSFLWLPGAKAGSSTKKMVLLKKTGEGREVFQVFCDEGEQWEMWFPSAYFKPGHFLGLHLVDVITQIVLWYKTTLKLFVLLHLY